MTAEVGAAAGIAGAAVLSGSLVVALCLAARLALGATRCGDVIRRLPGRRSEAERSRSAGFSFGHGPRWLAPALAAADIDVAPSTVWTAWCVGVLGATASTLVVAGPGLAVAGTALATFGPAVALRAHRGRASARVEAALPGALEAVARALRTGASLRQAVGEAAGRTSGALGRELEQVSTQAGRGVPLIRALDDLAARRPLPGMRLAVAALCLGAETGGAQARAVDGVATTLRDRLAVLGEVRALSSQARMSALVMSLAPLGFGAFAVTTDPRTAAFLFHTGAGFALLVAGATLDGLGWIWMNRLSRVSP